MRYSTQIKPVSYVKSHAAELLDRITEEREPIIITQNSTNTSPGTIRARKPTTLSGISFRRS
jgi:PHD/YefM family antitoxin component YafN of YafNO toxin-antitoxin module